MDELDFAAGVVPDGEVAASEPIPLPCELARGAAGEPEAAGGLADSLLMASPEALLLLRLFLAVVGSEPPPAASEDPALSAISDFLLRLDFLVAADEVSAPAELEVSAMSLDFLLDFLPDVALSSAGAD